MLKFIHAADFHIRKQERHFLLDFLGTGTQGLQRAAAGTALRCRLGITAVVTHEPLIGAVVGQSYTAPGAFRCLPAVHTDQSP